MKLSFSLQQSAFRTGAIVLGVVFGFAALEARLAAAECFLSGPAQVDVNQSFTLCGPSGPGYTYEWYGSGVSSGASSRCVTVQGRGSGTYEYVLITRYYGKMERCTQSVTVGGGGTGNLVCTIAGPASINAGQRAELCAPRSSLHTYQWTGPGGFTATTRCINVGVEGTYTVAIRNTLTGYTRECSHALQVFGGSDDSRCAISGPTQMNQGSRVTLCGPSMTNTSYRWEGPEGFTSTTRCITTGSPGFYNLTVMNKSTGFVERCTHRLDWSGYDGDDPDDADEIVSDNCPKALGFWRRQCNRTTGTAPELSEAEIRTLASCIDARSSYFNWTNDYNGFCRVLNPARPLTQRKQAARQFAALLANVCAGEHQLGASPNISLDVDTDVDVTFGSARTIGELIALSDRMLSAGRGNFSKLSKHLNSINSGRGIGPVCE